MPHSRPSAATSGAQPVESEVRALVAGEVDHLVVGTSGSSGGSRRVRLSRVALQASAAATHRRLGGPGNWLLCLPTSHIAGIQVLIRAVLAGTNVVTQPLDDGFAPQAFANTARELGPGRRYTSIVPTQLTRLLAHDEGTAALARFDAVLVGGAATDPELLTEARLAGVNAVTTYGMTETCGGCVYDGRALDGVELSIDPAGRIRVRGPVLADGYLDAEGNLDEAATNQHLTADGWWVTNDLGFIDHGLLRVTGRADRIINTGGVKVDPEAIAAAVRCALAPKSEALGDGAPGYEVHVLGLPDREWGERVVAAVTPTAGEDVPTSPVRWSTERVLALRTAIARELGRAAAPAEVFTVASLPRGDLGKVDQAALATLLQAAPQG
ncbi:AMP-binding protein [Rarobacter faecitabidus]|uniref:AMP-binding protein n=1 Tax=Rarobacter faecitabidus TaxID=13243 RepID=UPI001FE2B390|nr:AMP-binding protein [Rarobacter faecitabidus]